MMITRAQERVIAAGETMLRKRSCSGQMAMSPAAIRARCGNWTWSIKGVPPEVALHRLACCCRTPDSTSSPQNSSARYGGMPNPVART